MAIHDNDPAAAARAQRAADRSQRMTIVRYGLDDARPLPVPSTALERLRLAHQLSEECWRLGGREVECRARARWPGRVLRGDAARRRE